MRVRITVPATSANLGPGFDSLGLALDLRDTLTAETYDGPLQIQVAGEGADTVARDESHLVFRAMALAFAEMGHAVPGLRLTCHNVIPHARGLGSSSAAIVGGISLARELVAAMGEEALTVDAALDLANRIEGHPDNVAPAQLGGFTIAATEHGSVTLARLDVHPQIRAVAFVPPTPVETKVARGLLPAQVPHPDAAANAGRTAMLVAALTSRPDLLLPATRDWLHQDQRRPAMPDSLGLIDELRAAGHAATVSGAGPTVLVLTDRQRRDDVLSFGPQGWVVHTPAISADGVLTTR